MYFEGVIYVSKVGVVLVSAIDKKEEKELLRS
jgi:hypothetical protein